MVSVLTNEILLGQYRPGERLPSERDLAARFVTSRGAVREALKKLEQLGIAHISPGGSRVVPLEEATLEVIGPLLDLGRHPDPELVAEIQEIMDTLIGLAIRKTVTSASDSEIEVIRRTVDQLANLQLEDHAHMDLRIALTHQFLKASGNLVLSLISNSLRLQFAERLRPFVDARCIDHSATAETVQRLDTALLSRDADAASTAVRGLMRAVGDQFLRAIERARQQTAVS